ncbi:MULTISPECIES: queuosine precursor transporter [Legionella]|uniref:Queuosine precursor transporter n=1 Tax=Legionella drozanskii LLAP-1 TaxID=1212489 RepID=A0A0W0SME2_9GAMM|nr:MULTISPECIES: queuosine precursor transporter [Legionella]KTC84543.1 hypothetical protein Ldro_2707 [Legionella drozanskii LLAP-1]
MNSNAVPIKPIVLLSMLYMSLFFASVTVGYKIVAFGNQLYCASVLIFPLLFPFSDALTEIYGVQIAKSMVWYTVICEAVFVGLTNVAIRLPSPPNWHHQAKYDFFIGGYTHILLANATALIVSFYLNILLVNKWRILLKGKHYYMRSLGATAVGEVTYTIITNAITYYGVLRWQETANIIISDYLVKLVYSAIIAYPAALLVVYLKVKYKIDNTQVVFNPFMKNKIVKIADYR